MLVKRILGLTNGKGKMTEESIQTHAEKVLESINALIEKRATSDHQAYSVSNGISVTKLTIEELWVWKKRYEREVRLEVEAARIEAGGVKRNKIQTRFV